MHQFENQENNVIFTDLILYSHYMVLFHVAVIFLGEVIH